ncbi:TPA: hypothetical protein SCS57_002020 [Enterobacter cloacae]|nr:hypothetical protein [Enterobacter cloacae]
MSNPNISFALGRYYYVELIKLATEARTSVPNLVVRIIKAYVDSVHESIKE